MHLLVAHLPADVVPAILSPIVALIYLVAKDWKFSLVLVGYIGVCLALAAPSMRRAYRTNVDSWNLAMSTLTSATVELGDGIEVVKTYGSGSRAFARYSSAVDSMVAVCVRWMSGMGRPVVAMSILLSPAVLIVVITATGTAMLSGGLDYPPGSSCCLSGRRNRCSVVGSAHGNDGQPLPRRPTGSDSRREHPRRTRAGRTSGCSACSQHFGRIRQRRLRIHHWAARPREHLLRDATGHRDRDRWPPLRLRKDHFGASTSAVLGRHGRVYSTGRKRFTRSVQSRSLEIDGDRLPGCRALAGHRAREHSARQTRCNGSGSGDSGEAGANS